MISPDEPRSRTHCPIQRWTFCSDVSSTAATRLSLIFFQRSTITIHVTDGVTRNWKSNDPHAQSSSVPWSKVIANTSFETRAGCRGRSVAALKSCVKLFRSWYPHLLPPCYHDPFPVSRLIFVTGEIFFPIFTLLSFHPSRELRERMTRMKHFFFEITWGRKDG